MNSKQLKEQMCIIRAEQAKLDAKFTDLKTEFDRRYPSLDKRGYFDRLSYIDANCDVDSLDDANIGMRMRSLNVWLKKTAPLVARHMLLSRLMWKIHELFCPKHIPMYSDQEYVITYSLKSMIFKCKPISDTINILDVTFPDADTAKLVVDYLTYLVEEGVLVLKDNTFCVDCTKIV